MKQKLLALLLALTAVLTAAGCTGKPEKTNESFMAMDTFMQLDVYGDSHAAKQIRDRITALDKLLSATEKDSDIFRLNRDGAATADEATADVLEQSLRLCKSTGGALDVTVFPIVEAWGFISKDYRIPSKEQLKTLLALTDYRAVRLNGNEVTLPKGAKVDLGAVAKGYAADEAVKILDGSDSKSAILNLGGTVVAYGSKNGAPWKVGVADPTDSADYMGYLSLKDKIVATSGSYERYFTAADGTVYSHILDPSTGCPVNNGIVSVTVISDSGVRCDGLSTALFVMGKEKAADYYHAHRDFDFVILTDDGKAYVTGGIAENFTVADGHSVKVEVI